MIELLWEGKYRAGRRVTPLRVPLPLENLELVEATEQRETLPSDLEGWRNRLIWGDKRHVLPSLLPEFAGRIQLAYIDPPFYTGAEFSLVTPIPRLPGTGARATARTPMPDERAASVLRQSAYRDIWGGQLDTYVHWFYETTVLLRELLAEPATLYVHLDWHVSHYAKVVLDEVFGTAACLNEIIWKRHNARSAAPRVWPRLHDTLLVYSKGRGAVFHPQRVPADIARLPHTLITGADGRKYQTIELTAPGVTHGGESGRPWRGFDPSRWDRHWSVSHEQLDAWDAEGLIHWPARGGFPRRRAATPFDPGERQVIVGDIWADIDRINQAAEERWGYPTQKPEKLLERIIEASSNPGDLILDCFVGAGTTAVVAERLGRRWIAADRGRLAVHTTRKRLHTLAEVRPFVLQVPGERERRLWSAAGVPQDSDLEARTLAHRRLVLACYGAESQGDQTERDPRDGPGIHGRKADRLVHVGPAHRPFERDEVGLVLAAAVRARDSAGPGKSVAGVDILAWEFAFALDAEVHRLANTAGMQLLLRRIPLELLDLDAIDRPRITEFDFAPLRELTLRMTQQKRRVAVTLTDFILPAAALPPEARARAGSVTHWSQWIDYWAVDWEHEEPTFHNWWRAFRKRGASELPLQVTHEYPRPGSYLVAIQVIDLLGQETIRTLPLHLR